LHILMKNLYISNKVKDHNHCNYDFRVKTQKEQADSFSGGKFD